MILKNLIRNIQRVRVGHSDIVCLPADDYDEIINQFNKLYYEKEKAVIKEIPTSKAAVAKDQNALLNIKEAAQLLGVGKSTMYSYLKHEAAPKPIRFGRATRYKYSDVLRFIQYCSNK